MGIINSLMKDGRKSFRQIFSLLLILIN